MKMPKILRLSLAAAILATGTGFAAAETVTLHYAGPGSTLTTQVTLPTGTHNYIVGNYRLEPSGPAQSFLAFCVDPFQWASGSDRSYDKSSLASFLSGVPGSTTKLAEVTALFGHAYAGTIGNATKAAGFQLALWEVFNDSHNLSDGVVRTTGLTNVGAADEADRLLDALSGWTSTPGTAYQLTMYSNAAHQDFLAATPVPEPETVALLLGGLALLGVATRRRAVRHAA
jgi:hypothetical protein